MSGSVNVILLYFFKTRKRLLHQIALQPTALMGENWAVKEVVIEQILDKSAQSLLLSLDAPVPLPLLIQLRLPSQWAVQIGIKAAVWSRGKG